MASADAKAELKLQKKLREIEKIEAQLAKGEPVDALQLKKVETKAAIQEELERLFQPQNANRAPAANKTNRWSKAAASNADPPRSAADATRPAAATNAGYPGRSASSQSAAQAGRPASAAKQCIQCKSINDGSYGAPGTAYAKSWFCNACWTAWDSGSAVPFSGTGHVLGGGSTEQKPGGSSTAGSSGQKLGASSTAGSSGQKLGGSSTAGSSGQKLSGSSTAGSSGQTLGGSSSPTIDAEERRRKVLEAAEKRQYQVPGLSDASAAALSERQRRDELIGRISELHKRQGRDAPMGLGAASLVQLQAQLQRLRGGDLTQGLLELTS